MVRLAYLERLSTCQRWGNISRPGPADVPVQGAEQRQQGRALRGHGISHPVGTEGRRVSTRTATADRFPAESHRLVAGECESSIVDGRHPDGTLAAGGHRTKHRTGT